MLPPVDPATLSTNPKFNALYQDLYNNKLNADGTSKLDAKAQRERDGLGEDLRKARIETTKRDLIVSGLQNLSYRPDELPEELRDLVAVVAAMLEGQIADEDKHLLQDDVAKFKENIGTVTTALSKNFERDMNVLASVLDADTPPPVNSVPTTIPKLKTSISESQEATAGSRLALANEASKLHGLYRQALESSIRILEQTLHGSVARGAKAKADYLAAVAEGMSKKLNLQRGQLMSQLYTPEIQEALQTRLEESQKENAGLKRKVREAEEHLQEYRKAGGMERLAKEYAEILKESERVKLDISRLEEGRK